MDSSGYNPINNKYRSNSSNNIGSGNRYVEGESDYKVEIGDRVSISKGKYSGVVKYVGKIEGKEGDWVGIELDEKKGRNDGSYGHLKYFDCEPQYGIFVKYSKIVNSLVSSESQVLRSNLSNEFNKYDEYNEFIEYSGVYDPSLTVEEVLEKYSKTQPHLRSNNSSNINSFGHNDVKKNEYLLNRWNEDDGWAKKLSSEDEAELQEETNLINQKLNYKQPDKYRSSIITNKNNTMTQHNNYLKNERMKHDIQINNSKKGFSSKTDNPYHYTHRGGNTSLSSYNNGSDSRYESSKRRELTNSYYPPYTPEESWGGRPRRRSRSIADSHKYFDNIYNKDKKKASPDSSSNRDGYRANAFEIFVISLFKAACFILCEVFKISKVLISWSIDGLKRCLEWYYREDHIFEAAKNMYFSYINKEHGKVDKYYRRAKHLFDKYKT